MVSHYCRIVYADFFRQNEIHHLIFLVALFGVSLFPFVLGVISYREKWFSKWSIFIARFQQRNLILGGLIVLGIIAHSIIKTSAIAPFTGFLFIFCFNLMKLPRLLEKFLEFISVHSTNIWLTHMFFYAIFFEQLIYAPQYPLAVYCWLLLWCIAASYLINIFNKPLISFVNSKLEK